MQFPACGASHEPAHDRWKDEMRITHSRCRFPWLLPLVAAMAALGAPAGAQQHMEIAARDAINPGLPTPPPPQVSRSTPAASWRSFLALGKTGNFAAAANLLDLTEVPAAQQGAVGADVAEKLYRVVAEVGLAPDAVSNDDPRGPVEGGSPLNVVVAGRFRKSGVAGEIWLRRTRDDKSGEVAWLFTRQTVSDARFWYQVMFEGARPHAAVAIDAGLGAPPVTVHRSNPRETVAGFLAATAAGHFRDGAFYLDLGGLPEAKQPSEGPRLARRLMLVLLRTGWIDPARISNDPLGAPEAGVPDNEEKLAEATVGDRKVDLTLARVWDAQRGQIWTFSRASVGEIDALYGTYGFGWVGDHLPRVFFSVELLGLRLWQWATLLLIILAGWVVSRVVGHWLARALRALAGRTRIEWDDAFVGALDGPLGFILWALAVALASPLVGLTPSAQQVTHVGWKLLALIGVAWLLFRAVDALTARLRGIGATRPLALSFAPIVQRIGKVLVVAFVLLAALDVVGINVVALLAGFGLGGLAVAFAAQKTLENLFGAVAIAGDRPFRVGDFVQIGDIVGTIEDIGLRSTKVRTLQRTIVTMPNGAVVGGNIINYTVRDRMLYNPVIGVTYGTTAAQLVYITDEVRKLLLTHPRVWPGVTRCRFKEFGAYSLNLEVFCWIDTPDYNEFTALAEELNFRIAEIVEAAGSSFAFPSQTLFLTREAAADAERPAAVAQEVERRRQQGELAVPEPSDALLAQLLAQRKPPEK
jgi:MscS family membrane protein